MPARGTLPLLGANVYKAGVVGTRKQGGISVV
jgi:hypothetical protein